MNKKYYAYAVTLAIFSFSQLAADITAKTAEVPKGLGTQLDNAKFLVSRFFFRNPDYGFYMQVTQTRAQILLEAISQRKERALQGVVSMPHQLEVMLKTVSLSEEVFVARSIDWVFEHGWELFISMKLNEMTISPIIYEGLRGRRANELFDYLHMRRDIKDCIKDIKTIDKLEFFVSSVNQLFKDFAAFLQPDAQKAIKAFAGRRAAELRDYNLQEVASVRDN